YIGRLKVTMDDSLLVGVLNPPTDVHEEFEALFDCELALVAEFGDGHPPLDQFHDKVGATARARLTGGTSRIASESIRFRSVDGSYGARVKDLGNVGMVH